MLQTRKNGNVFMKIFLQRKSNISLKKNIIYFIRIFICDQRSKQQILQLIIRLIIYYNIKYNYKFNINITLWYENYFLHFDELSFDLTYNILE